MSATILASTASPAQAHDTRRVVTVMPSVGAGGGIEQYVRGVLELLPAGTDVVRVAPEGGFSGWSKVRFAIDLVRHVRMASRTGDIIFVFHPSFLPLVSLAAGRRAGSRIVAFFYGAEIWSAAPLRRRLWRTLPYRAVTISGYSAGALDAITRRCAAVLPPPVPRSWFESLVAVGPIRASRASVGVLSVFRLPSAEEKGARTLVRAVESLRDEGHCVELRLAGKGPTPQWVRELAETRSWLMVLENPDEAELALEYQQADIFALATRTRFGPMDASGEGFGIVLVEAALAGLPVVGPASGGARDALVDGFSGEVPADESAEALAACLGRLLDERTRKRMGERGRAWAIERFGPAGREGLEPMVAALLRANEDQTGGHLAG